MSDETNKSATEVLEEKANLVGIRFKPCGKTYIFDPGDIELEEGDLVVVESMFGLTLGRVVTKNIRNREQKEIKKVIRKATEEDLRAHENNRPLEEDARRFCLERIKARGLPMKLVTTEATLDRRRIIFYFTADGRIDFRELVKDLAAKFRTRIEMRQIGVRDEAKMLGGIGICGRQLCCNSFLSNFAPISIKMAKDQELVLNTSKLTGICGRLMCCLSYEYDGPIEGEIDEALEGCLCEECPADELPYSFPEEEKKVSGTEEPVAPPVKEDREAVTDRGSGTIAEAGAEQPRPHPEPPSVKAEEGDVRKKEGAGERFNRKRPFKKRKGVSSHKKRKKKRKRKGR